jgi:hypothetical protein
MPSSVLCSTAIETKSGSLIQCERASHRCSAAKRRRAGDGGGGGGGGGGLASDLTKEISAVKGVLQIALKCRH